MLLTRVMCVLSMRRYGFVGIESLHPIWTSCCKNFITTSCSLFTIAAAGQRKKQKRQLPEFTEIGTLNAIGCALPFTTWSTEPPSRVSSSMQRMTALTASVKFTCLCFPCSHTNPVRPYWFWQASVARPQHRIFSFGYRYSRDLVKSTTPASAWNQERSTLTRCMTPAVVYVSAFGIGEIDDDTQGSVVSRLRLPDESGDSQPRRLY